MIIKFKSIGCCDEMLVTKPNGESLTISGVGVIDYVINNYKIGEVKNIELKNFRIPINPKAYSEIEQVTKAKVTICHDE